MNQPPTEFIRIRPEVLQDFLETCLRTCALDAEHARLIAALLTSADLRGIHSHGAPQLERYVRRLQDGQINPAPQIRAVREENSLVVVDGDGGFGYLPTVRVTEMLIDRAKTSGIAAGAVRHIGHYGAASHYTRMCAAAGCVGFSVQGVASGTTFPDLPIALWGSRPISFAIPAGARPPIIVDGCTNLFREKDLDLFAQVPSAFFMSLGFTVVSKLLGDALSGQMLLETREPPNPWSAARTGAFVLAVAVDHFTSLAGFQDIVDSFIDGICTQMRPMPGYDRATLPGTLEAEREQAYKKEGIPLATATCRRLEEIARQLDVPVPWSTGSDS